MSTVGFVLHAGAWAPCWNSDCPARICMQYYTRNGRTGALAQMRTWTYEALSLMGARSRVLRVASLLVCWQQGSTEAHGFD